MHSLGYYVHYKHNPIAIVEVSDGQLVADKPTVQEIVDSKLRRNDGDIEKTYQDLLKYNNGYSWFAELGKGSPEEVPVK